MKIACITSSQIPATTANSVQVMKVCQALAQTGAAVRLIIPGPSDECWDELAGLYGLTTRFEMERTVSRRGLRRYDLAWNALGRAQAWGADLVYTWLPQAGLLALMRGLPAVLEVHDRPTGRLGPWLLRRFCAHPGRHRAVIITHALQRVLEREYGCRFAPGEAVIAPNGVESERYTGLPTPEVARRALNLPAGWTAAYTGHFYAGRGMDVLFGLAQRFPQVHFLWVGGKPEAVADWQARLAQAGVSNVTLTGFVENRRLPLYQAAGDLLLMPYERSIAGSSGGNSAEICSPMKMFEYMAAGRAILTSDLPVIREVLDEDSAVFCPPEDLSVWSAALQSLLNDPPRIARLGEAAQAKISAYTWRARAERALAGLA